MSRTPLTALFQTNPALKEITLEETTYTIENLLGEGGQGFTYSAVTADGEKWVIKECYPEEYHHGDIFRERTENAQLQPFPDSATQNFLSKFFERFDQEVKVIADGGIPHTVPTKGPYNQHGTKYFVMKYIEATTLKEQMDKLRLQGLSLTFSANMMHKIVESLVESLDAFHKSGLIHSDVKPSNILVDSYDSKNPSDLGIYLIDFGSCRAIGSKSTPITTLRYAPPEVILHRGVEFLPHFDIFMVAATALALFEGTALPLGEGGLSSQEIINFSRTPEGPWRDLLSAALRYKKEDRPKDIRQWWNAHMAAVPSSPEIITISSPYHLAVRLPQLPPNATSLRVTTRNEELQYEESQEGESARQVTFSDLKPNTQYQVFCEAVYDGDVRRAGESTFAMTQPEPIIPSPGLVKRLSDGVVIELPPPPQNIPSLQIIQRCGKHETMINREFHSGDEKYLELSPQKHYEIECCAAFDYGVVRSKPLSVKPVKDGFLVIVRKRMQQIDQERAGFSLGRFLRRGLLLFLLGILLGKMTVTHWQGIKEWSGDAATYMNVEWTMMSGDKVKIFNLAHDYAKNGKLSLAKELYEKGVALGGAAAMNNLGVMYGKGEGVPQNHTKAIELYEKAVSLGNPVAMANLGRMYVSGIGVHQDYAKAKKLLEKAADLGEARAMNNLGWMYYSGEGVTQNYTKAMEWYKKAAVLGDSDAMFAIGSIYETGAGAPQNSVKAKEWYEKAAALDNSYAMYILGWMYYSGEGVTQNYTKAMEWYKKAAVLGDSDAMFAIGSIYETGAGVPQNFIKAMEWYEKAAALDNSYAMYNLGDMYEKGQGVAKDLKQAKQWYKRAKEQEEKEKESSTITYNN